MSSISRVLRGSGKGNNSNSGFKSDGSELDSNQGGGDAYLGRKDHSISGILGGEFFLLFLHLLSLILLLIIFIDIELVELIVLNGIAIS